MRIAAAFCLVLAACAPAGTVVSDAAAPAAALTLAQSDGSITGLLNAQRSSRGLSGLSEDARLSQAAAAHARDMATNGYFSHTSLDGTTFDQRARRAGYSCIAAENIAEGQRTEAAVMSAWMNSAGHRANILNPRYREFGIGRSGNVWVMMFGRGC